MAKFFINRPIFAIVLALVISIAGMLCIFTLPVDRYPKITPPQVSVQRCLSRCRFGGCGADGGGSHREECSWSRRP